MSTHPLFGSPPSGEVVRERQVWLDSAGRPSRLVERITVRRPEQFPQPEWRGPPGTAVNPAARPRPQPPPHRPLALPTTPSDRPDHDWLGAAWGVAVSVCATLAWAWMEIAFSLAPLALLLIVSWWRRELALAVGVVAWGLLGWAVWQTDPLLFATFLLAGAALGGAKS